MRVLTPEEWFERGHGLVGGSKNTDNIWIPNYTKEFLLWIPPPAAADVAIKLLAHSRHFNPYTSHVFVCPRLMTYTWRKMLLKTADSVFYVSPGCRSFWSCDMHETLTVGILVPFLLKNPWQLRRSQKILELERELRGVWKRKDRDERIVLRKFWV